MSWIAIVIVLSLLLFHWVADFVLQTDEQALNKSSSNKYLADHVLTYVAAITIAITVFQAIFLRYQPHFWQFCAFMGITFSCHFITDYITSRVNAKLWKADRRHGFFVNIGFDQLLHYIQLLITYKLIYT